MSRPVPRFTADTQVNSKTQLINTGLLRDPDFRHSTVTLVQTEGLVSVKTQGGLLPTSSHKPGREGAALEPLAPRSGHRATLATQTPRKAPNYLTPTDPCHTQVPGPAPNNLVPVLRADKNTYQSPDIQRGLIFLFPI